jgi:hypothetical protein
MYMLGYNYFLNIFNPRLVEFMDVESMNIESQLYVLSEHPQVSAQSIFIKFKLPDS